MVGHSEPERRGGEASGVAGFSPLRFFIAEFILSNVKGLLSMTGIQATQMTVTGRSMT
jgi:hypothetical protein